MMKNMKIDNGGGCKCYQWFNKEQPVGFTNCS